MPQIRCPNCGFTINLEKRKKTDIYLITNAVKRETKTFTDLLHMTGLPRKTLNLRLKELCEKGVLIKAEGGYKLNGHSNSKENFCNTLGKVVHNEKFKGLAILMVLLVGFPTLSYALASMFQSTVYQEPEPEPQILGAFTMSLQIHGVENLFSWQCVISYDPAKLKILDIRPGEFLGVDQIFTNATDLQPGVIVMFGSLQGGDASRSGDGTLATISFGYFDGNYEPPEIISTWKYLDMNTCWWELGDPPKEHLDPTVFSLSLVSSTGQ